MHFLNMFFFDIYPYIAGSVFLIGSWLRYDYGQYTWRAAKWPAKIPRMPIWNRFDARFIPLRSSIWLEAARQVYWP